MTAPEDYLDPPSNLYDYPAVIGYRSRLDEARRLAQLNGLESGLCLSLDLTIPPPNPHPHARSLPNLPQKTPIPFRLGQPLQSGPGKNSQVWTAVGTFAGAQTTVVLKIIQPSMCRYPSNDMWPGNYLFPEDLAREEASAYNELEHKQGLFIPYFFGLHTVSPVLWNLI